MIFNSWVQLIELKTGCKIVNDVTCLTALLECVKSSWGTAKISTKQFNIVNDGLWNQSCIGVIFGDGSDLTWITNPGCAMVSCQLGNLSKRLVVVCTFAPPTVTSPPEINWASGLEENWSVTLTLQIVYLQCSLSLLKYMFVLIVRALETVKYYLCAKLACPCLLKMG